MRAAVPVSASLVTSCRSWDAVVLNDELGRGRRDKEAEVGCEHARFAWLADHRNCRASPALAIDQFAVFRAAHELPGEEERQ